MKPNHSFSVAQLNQAFKRFFRPPLGRPAVATN
jgi:hypothetical protein